MNDFFRIKRKLRSFGGKIFVWGFVWWRHNYFFRNIFCCRKTLIFIRKKIETLKMVKMLKNILYFSLKLEGFVFWNISKKKLFYFWAETFIPFPLNKPQKNSANNFGELHRSTWPKNALNASKVFGRKVLEQFKCNWLPIQIDSNFELNRLLFSKNT